MLGQCLWAMSHLVHVHTFKNFVANKYEINNLRNARFFLNQSQIPTIKIHTYYTKCFKFILPNSMNIKWSCQKLFYLTY